jgi:uncharacterized protein YqeY
MSFAEKIDNDLKQAMLAREKEKLEAIRAVKTAFILARSEKGAGSVLTEPEEIKIMQKLVKQRKESAAIYKDQNRQDLYEKEMIEAVVIEAYLPAQMDEAEIRKILQKIITETDAQGMKEIGKVMSLATKELAGKADGKIISGIVKELLG